MKIKTILIDDHALFREGVARLMEMQQDVSIVATFQNSLDAEHYLKSNSVDIAIIDIVMPKEYGIDVVRRVRAISSDIKILILSAYINEEYVFHSLNSGADGYLVKSATGQELVKALRTIAAGRRYLCPETNTVALAERMRSRSKTDLMERLSRRERQVLDMTVSGLTIAETAETLSISPKSVATYRARIMEKLDVKNVYELIKFAIRHGISDTWN